mmetsp:Transcript_75521/g.233637  ORF Transcript_75521/g.233637 Transcript_75521/m.233637 type:complete len:246 (-) Transcript_75521:145-882(-)
MAAKTRVLLRNICTYNVWHLTPLRTLLEVLRAVGADLVSWQSLGCLPPVHLLCGMRDRAVAPNVVTYSTAINACEKGGRLAMVRQVFTEMSQLDVVPDVVTFSALIGACEQSLLWELALHVLSEKQVRRVMPDEQACSAAISACEKCRQWQAALSLMGEMEPQEVLTSAEVCNVANNACEKGQWWKVTMLLSQGISDGGCEPDMISYSAALRAYGRWLHLRSEVSSACEKDGWQYSGRFVRLASQ